MKNNFNISFDLDIVKLYIQQILHSAKSLMCVIHHLTDIRTWK